MTPEELNKMTPEELEFRLRRATAQGHAEDRAAIKTAVESGGRSGGAEAAAVIRKYVVGAGKNARDEYKTRHSIPAWRPVTNEELGWDVTVGDVDLALYKIRYAGWTRGSIQEEVRKLGAKSRGILDAEQLLKHLDMA